MSAFSGAQLIGAGGGAVVGPLGTECIIGRYPDSTPRNCSLCHQTCATCVNGLGDHCMSAYANAYIWWLVLGGTWGYAVPNPGYYADPHAGNCSACDVSCRSCVGPNAADCTSAWEWAHLQTSPGPSITISDDGYWADPNTKFNSLCHHTCLTCANGLITG
jgi:hypothetical protein